MKKTIILIVVLAALIGLGVYFSNKPLQGDAVPAAQEQTAINERNAIAPGAEVTVNFQPAAVGDEVQLSDNTQKEVALVNGWSVIENWGVWSSAKTATFGVAAKNLPEKFTIELTYSGFVTESHPKQTFHMVNAKGQALADCDYVYSQSNKDNKTVSINITKSQDADADGNVFITVEAPDAITPVDAGLSSGDRLLGIGLVSLKILA